MIGVDNLNDYYDVRLKQARLSRFQDHGSYTHIHADLADREAMEAAFSAHQPQRVVHLAAQDADLTADDTATITVTVTY